MRKSCAHFSKLSRHIEVNGFLLVAFLHAKWFPLVGEMLLPIPRFQKRQEAFAPILKLLVEHL